MKFNTVLIEVFILVVISTAVLSKVISCDSEVPKSDFIVSKSALNSDVDLKQKVSKELGKVSGNV